MYDGLWKLCKGFVVFVKNGKIVKYFAADDESAKVVYMKKPISVGAFRVKKWREERMGENSADKVAEKGRCN